MYEVLSEPYVYIYMHNLLFWGLSKLWGIQSINEHMDLENIDPLFSLFFSSSFILWCLDTIVRYSGQLIFKAVQCRQEGVQVPEWTLASLQRALQADIDKHELPSWGWFGLGWVIQELLSELGQQVVTPTLPKACRHRKNWLLRGLITSGNCYVSRTLEEAQDRNGAQQNEKRKGWVRKQDPGHLWRLFVNKAGPTQKQNTYHMYLCEACSWPSHMTQSHMTTRNSCMSEMW